MASSSNRSRNRRRFDVDSLSLPADELPADEFDDDATVLEDSAVVDEAALRSFILEVSARRPKGVGDATDATDAVVIAHRTAGKCAAAGSVWSSPLDSPPPAPNRVAGSGRCSS